ncbi:MAG: response regulator [Myxococcota bacterium]
MTKRRPTILVCEDEELIRWALEERLRQDGFHPIMAGDGVRCLDRVAEFSPDVMVLDMTMPGRTGLEVLYQLAGTEQRVPVILLTARAVRDPDVQRALEIPRVRLVEKPFNLDDVVDAIHELLK